MVELFLRRLKMWMGLSRAKEVRVPKDSLKFCLMHVFTNVEYLELGLASICVM